MPYILNRPTRRKVFVSYHHRNDQQYYDSFSKLFHESYDLIADNSLERAMDSADFGLTGQRFR